jgi:hypothetical protein
MKVAALGEPQDQWMAGCSGLKDFVRAAATLQLDAETNDHC